MRNGSLNLNLSIPFLSFGINNLDNSTRFQVSEVGLLRIIYILLGIRQIENIHLDT